jgi:hypothetical protein
MSLPHYDFGQPPQLTPEMLEAALVVRLDIERVTPEQMRLVLKAAQILKVVKIPHLEFSYEILNQVADGVLLAWPEG